MGDEIRDQFADTYNILRFVENTTVLTSFVRLQITKNNLCEKITKMTTQDSCYWVKKTTFYLLKKRVVLVPSSFSQTGFLILFSRHVTSRHVTSRFANSCRHVSFLSAYMNINLIIHEL